MQVRYRAAPWTRIIPARGKSTSQDYYTYRMRRTGGERYSAVLATGSSSGIAGQSFHKRSSE